MKALLSILVSLLVIAGLFAVLSFAKDTEQINVYSAEKAAYVTTDVVDRSPIIWRLVLTSEQYRILREKGTEPRHTGKYDKHYEHGIYRCAGCGLDLYSSKDKYDSKSGWPSFTAPIAEENIKTAKDFNRTELLCARCDGHLGHVFGDGPPPTGKRHCINSASLKFVSVTKGVKR